MIIGPENTQMSFAAKVAIITRTKNRPNFLRRAARSISQQSYRNFIWVVVDDVSDQPEDVDTIVLQAGIPKSQTLVIHRSVSCGMEAASNDGIFHSNSEYIVIHDDDDSWSPEFLNCCIEFLNENPIVNGVVTRTSVITEKVDGHRIIQLGENDYSSHFRVYWSVPTLMQILAVNLFPPISFVYRRAVIDKIGYYDESLPVLGDWEFNVRFLREFDIGVINEFHANYHLRIRSEGEYNNNSQTNAQGEHEKYDALLRNKWIRQNNISSVLAAQGNIMQMQMTILNHLADVKYMLEHRQIGIQDFILNESISENYQLASRSVYNLARLVVRKFWIRN